MADEPNNFDDSGLKEAVRKLRGGHRAEPELRDKVAALMKAQATPPGRSWFKPFMAIAAVLAIAIAGYNFYLQRQLEQPTPKGDQLLIAMVAAHANNSATNSGCHALDAPLTNPAALVAEASKKLDLVIPKLTLGDWKITSATICTFDSSPGLRLQLARSDQTVTLISVSKNAAASYGADHYEKMVNEYPIAGVIINDTLTCVVADATSDPEARVKQVAQIRDQLLGR